MKFKNFMLESTKDNISAILSDMSPEEINEFGEWLYDEYLGYSEDNTESEEDDTAEDITIDEINELLADLDDDDLAYILTMLEDEEFSEEELDEGVSRTLKAKNRNRTARKKFQKSKSDLRKDKTKRKKANRMNKASRKRYYRANKSKIKSYAKSRRKAISAGKHKVKIRRKA